MMENLAFLISCGQYERDEIENLSNIKSDGIKMQNAFMQYLGLSEDKCYSLYDSSDIQKRPTQTNVWNMLEMPDDSNKYNTIFFYYSGHGFLNRDNELCIMTRDSRLKPYPLMYIKITEIVDFLEEEFDFEHIIFILDMCQTYRNDAKGITDIGFPNGVLTVCSCFPDGESYMLPDKLGEGSLFTHCFIESLKQAKSNDTIAQIVEVTRRNMLSLDKDIDSGQICYLKVDYYELGNISLDTLIYGEINDVANNDILFDENDKYLSYVPKPIKFFCERTAELQWLEYNLKNYSKPIFISGDGGIGKTSLVLQFVSIHSEYSYCFAVYHENLYETISSIEFLDKSKRESVDGLSEEKRYYKNMEILKGYGSKIVLIIDNYDSENYASNFRKLSEQKPYENERQTLKNQNIINELINYNICLIFTTRIRISETAYNAYELRPIASRKLVEFIVKMCDTVKWDKYAIKMLREIINSINGLTILAELLISVLKKKPSVNALEKLYSAIINENYKEHQIAVISEYDSMNATIYVHLKKMFNFLELSQEEQEILRIISLLPVKGISIKLFYDLNRNIINDKLVEKLHALRELRLININHNKISMHPIISVFVKEELKPDINNCKNFLSNLMDSYHTDEVELYSRSFIEDVCFTLAQAADRIPQSLMKAELYDKAGIISRRSGMYIFSRKMQLRAISILEADDFPDYKILATYYSNIANLFLDMGELDSADKYQEKALSLRKKKLGEDHPDTAMSYCNLALIYSQYADYDNAERYQKKAINILENAQDDYELSLAIAYSNMGQIYYEKKKYNDAVHMEKKAIKIRRLRLDKNSPYLATSYNNISLYYHKLKDEDEAEKYIKAAIDIQEKNLGYTHPYLGISYNNLALVLKARKKYQEAIEYQLKDIQIKVNGNEEKHWNMATSYDNLADLLYLTEKYQEAKMYQEKAIKIREETQGESHPDLYDSYRNMINILTKIGESDEVVFYCKKMENLKSVLD